MRVACIAFVAGAWWLQQQAALVDGRLALAGLIAALLVVVVVERAVRRRAATSVATERTAADGRDQRRAVTTSGHQRRLASVRAMVASVAAPVGNAQASARASARARVASVGATGAGDPATVGGDRAGAARDPATLDPATASDRAGVASDRARVADDRTRVTGDRASTGATIGVARVVASVVAATVAIVATGVAPFIAGFAWATWRADQRLVEALPHELEGRDIVVVGTVAALPGLDPRGVRFPFVVESVVSRDADGRTLAVPSHLSLGWYRPQHGANGAGDGSIPDIRPGQRWRLTVRLKRPHGSANPAGFDYEYWLLEDGQRATGSVRPGADDTAGDDDDDEASQPTATATRKLDAFVWSVDHVVERARAHLRDRVLATLGDGRPIATSAPYAGVIVALIVGDQRAIPQSDWTVFNRTGIGHLVSISGLHVSMLAALGAWLVFAAWRRRPALCGRLPAHQAAALAGTLVALVYCLLAGFGVPAQRTLYMIGVVALALWTHRLSSVSRVLCIALAIVVALDPWAVMGSGFWLSFTAVGAIFYVSSGRLVLARPTDARARRAGPALRTAARVQWAVTLALTPLTLLFFDQVSIVSPLANAIAIPLVSFVVTPLALVGAVLPGFVGSALLHAAHGLVALLAIWLQWLSAAPVAVWTGAMPGPVAFACAMIGVAWWLAPRGVPMRWTGALWMVPLFLWPPDRPDAGDVRFTALDIGQGTSVLIETHATNVLYDTGPVYSPDTGGGSNDAGNRIIVPFLRARGIARLDTMIVSHNDNDHSGGALSVLQSLTVLATRTSLAFDTPIVRAAPNHARCVAGQGWDSDGVRFDLIAPDPQVYEPHDGKALAKPNAKSCVLRVASHGRVMLLTADIERPQELALVERRPADLVADVILVPHHGSRTSSSDTFLDTVRPSAAIVQAGYLNRFGHPRPDVMARYAARGIDVLRNDRDGAVTVTMRAGAIDIDRYRDSHRRYWYDR